MPCVLLEDKASIAPQYICLVERTHDLLHQVDVAETLRQLWLLWLPVTVRGLAYLPLLIVLWRVCGPCHQMHYLVVLNLSMFGSMFLSEHLSNYVHMDRTDHLDVW